MAIPIHQALKQAFGHDDHVRILHVETISAGKLLLPESRKSYNPLEYDPPRIKNSVTVVKLFLRTTGPAPEIPHPTAGTDVGMEIWLPDPKVWNDRIRIQIQGGLAGDPRITSKDHFSEAASTDLENGQVASDLGYVVSSTDGGHVADSIEDGEYLLNQDGSANVEGWKNIAWQATHLLGIKTKALTTAYYGHPAKYSYLVGWSTGGRAAYQSAQKFPDSFDGILIGFPSITQSLMFPSLIHPHIVINNDLDGHGFTEEQLEMVCRKALAMGDSSVTGQHDGYFTDWKSNTYDPSKDFSIISLKDGGTCTEPWALSLAQCHAMNKIWYGPTLDGQVPDPKVDNGSSVKRPANQLWWGKLRGTRIAFAHEPRDISGSHLALVYANPALAPPTWRNPLSRNAWQTWTYEEYAKALQQSRKLDDSFENMDADNPDLRPIQALGKKILVFHGLADEIVSPQSTINYWLNSAELTGGYDKTIDFHRLFLVPGMGHSPRGMGCVSTASVPLPSAEYLFKCLAAWVERGEVPDSIPGRSWDGEVSRPIYLYPHVAMYDGKGDPSCMTSFSCSWT